jgi:Flp pilus assembly pilin Flp
MDQINQALIYMKNGVRSLFTREEGQDTLEYILIVGAVSVAVIAALLLVSPGEIVYSMCTAIKGIDGFGTLPCTDPSP